MGIRIASQPVGAPILAATSTAVAQANERRGAMQARMFQDEQRRKAIQDERQADREFQLQRDKTAAEEAEKRRLADVEEFDRRDAAYRRKDALGSLYDEIARREKFYSSTPLTPDGMKQRDAMAQKLREIREAEARGYRPNEMIGFYSQWIEEFDKQNPSSWEDKPRPTIEDFSKRSMYLDKDGRIIPNEAVDSGGVIPSWSNTQDAKGGWGGWQKWGGSGVMDDKEADAKFKWAKGEVDKWVSSNGMEAADNPENRQKWMREKLNEYDQMQEMIRSGAYKDGQPGQPAPQQQGQPQPVPQQAAVPGDGQALPVPAAPFQPPTQPLNAGDVVLPGGPSQLAPPPRDYAAEVAATQAGLRTDASGRMLDANGNPVQVDPRDMQPVLRTDKDGRMVDAQGNRITTDVRDMQPVLRTDSQGRQVDAAGNPVQSAPGDMQAAQPRLNPDDAAALVQRARAMDPQNAQMYDKADALFKGKPREQWTEEDITLFFEAYRRAWTAGLTQ